MTTEKSSESKTFWAKILDQAPLPIRRRASHYLENIKQISESEWKVWSSSGSQYTVQRKDREITCTCPYFQEGRGFCKHIASVAANQLIELDYKPWKEKLEAQFQINSS
jgi:hypothetical protein